MRVAEIEIIFRKEWEKIPRKIIMLMVKSMPKRKKVLKAQGFVTQGLTDTPSIDGFSQ